MTVLPTLCRGDRTVVEGDGGVYTVLCDPCLEEFSRDYAPVGVELSRYLTYRSVRLSTKRGSSHPEHELEGVASLLRHGIRGEDREAFSAFVESRFRERSVPVGSAMVTVRVPADRFVGRPNVYDSDLTTIAAAYVLDVEDYAEVGIPVDVALGHAFLGTSVPVAAFFESRYRGDSRDAGYIPATKAEKGLNGHTSGARYLALRLPEAWSRFLGEPDPVVLVDRMREEYPGVLRPSSLASFVRLGVTEKDAVTWFRAAKERWDGSYRPEGFGGGGLAELASSYSQAGFTPESGTKFGFFTGAESARSWSDAGFDEYAETVRWRDLLLRFSVEYGEKEAFERIAKLRAEGVPPEWATSFEDAKVVD